ncbi:MAG: hypothetical protein ABWX74_12785 [Aeromicrobium sp.]
MTATTVDDYPALGFDPAPGDVAGVEEAASVVRFAQRKLEDVAEALTQTRVERWRGALATAFEELLGLEVRPVIERAGIGLDDSGRHLDDWSEKLKGLQRRARDIELEAAAARQRLGTARDETADAGSADDQERRIRRADDELGQCLLDAQALQREYTSEGEAAARLLADAEDTVPSDLRRLDAFGQMAEILVGPMDEDARRAHLEAHPEVAALIMELQLRSEGLLDGEITSDAYRQWLLNAARRGVSPDTMVDIARRHDLDQDDFALLDGLEEVTDPDGKSFFVLPTDISVDDARRAVLMTYVYNAGTDYGSASPDNDFPETPYSADEIQRIIDRQDANSWSYVDDVRFVHGNGGRLVTTPNGMLMGLGGNIVQDQFSQNGGTTYGDVFMLNIDDADDPTAVLREVVEGGHARYQDSDGDVYAGSLDLDRLLHHEERHSQQWAEEGYVGFLASYGLEQITRTNETEEGAGLHDGGYE